MGIFSGVGASGTVGPASGGKTTGLNNVGTTGAQVIAANPARVNITFHNPGTVNVFVYPLRNASGGTNAPTNALPGGAYVVYPAASITMAGECQGAWGAFAVSGGTNPLTISESNL